MIGSDRYEHDVPVGYRSDQIDCGLQVGIVGVDPCLLGRDICSDKVAVDQVLRQNLAAIRRLPHEG